MKEVLIKSTKPYITLMMYEEIEELPVTIFNRVNEYALLDAEIGHTMADVNRRFEKLDKFLSAKKYDEAIQERKNLQQTIWNMQQGTNFPALQFSCFIYSIDGKEVEDHSQENLNRIISDLSDKGVSMRLVSDVLEEVKKKINSELKICFPDRYTETVSLNYYQQLKRQIQAQLNFILNPDERFLEDIKRVQEYFLTLITPKNFDGGNRLNVVVRGKVDFESLCVGLIDRGVPEPEKMSVFRFFTTLNYYEHKEKKT